MSDSNLPLVSVVVPTRNRAELLSRCLTALTRQTYSRYEVIVVDDGSEDATPGVLERFATQHPDLRFRHFRNEYPRGANPSRNRAIRESKGEFIAFEDDDCIAEPEWIERLVDGFDGDRVGAVTGIVLDPEPRNLWDTAFKGTNRVYGKRHATRLVLCNLCVRRQFLERSLDEDRAGPASDMSVSGRGDEEGLNFHIARQGYDRLVADDARVLHVHHYTRRSFFKQAYNGGGAAARFEHKYRLWPRPELVCLLGTYVCLPWLTFTPTAGLASLGCFALFAGAITYNELWRKRKTPWETAVTWPHIFAYYHVRGWAYFRQHARLRLGLEHLDRVRR